MSRGKKKQKIITEVRKDEVPNGVIELRRTLNHYLSEKCFA